MDLHGFFEVAEEMLNEYCFNDSDLCKFFFFFFLVPRKCNRFVDNCVYIKLSCLVYAKKASLLRIRGT